MGGLKSDIIIWFSYYKQGMGCAEKRLQNVCEIRHIIGNGSKKVIPNNTFSYRCHWLVI